MLIPCFPAIEGMGQDIADASNILAISRIARKGPSVRRGTFVPRSFIQ